MLQQSAAHYSIECELYIDTESKNKIIDTASRG